MVINMLNFILGVSGSGKTHTLRKLFEDKLSSNEKLMLIVPEQCSFETEKRILGQFGAKNAQRVSILSFSRLASQLFDEYGKHALPSLSAGARAVLVKRALKTVGHELDIYKPVANLAGFSEKAAQLLSEMKTRGITPEALGNSAMEVDDALLGKKLNELSLIAGAYEAMLGNDVFDPYDDLTRAFNILKEHGFFAGYTVAFDEFTAFGTQELSIIGEMLRQANDVFVTLCTDGVTDLEHGLGVFSPVKKTAQTLISLANKHGVTVKEPVILNENHRAECDGIAFLHRHAFSFGDESMPPDGCGIELHTAADYYEEAEYVSRTILRLVREDGLRYRDFAVIARSSDLYSGILDSCFSKYGIHFFKDRREPIDVKPLIAYVLSALSVAVNGFRTDDILRMLKTGLSPLETGEIAMLENYVFTWSISGSAWKSEWKDSVDGFETRKSRDGQEQLDRLNTWRERIISPFIRLSEKMKSADSTNISASIVGFLDETGVSERVVKLSEALLDDGEFDLSQEEIRTWDALMDMLDEMAESVQESVLPAEYLEFFRLVISNRDLGHIPLGPDDVIIGSADRIRPVNKKVIFIIGANDGVFPGVPEKHSLFSDRELKKLRLADIELRHGHEELMTNELLYAYLSLTSSTGRVFVSYVKTGGDGSAMYPSAIVSEILRRFTGIETIDEDALSDAEKIAHEAAAFEMTARLYNDNTPFSAALKSYFSHNEASKDSMAALARAAKKEPFIISNAGVANALFKKDISMSASAIESFHKCRFAYFCRYGLGASPRVKADIDSRIYGSLVHHILEHIFERFPDGISGASPVDVHAHVRGILEKYIDDNMGDSAHSPRIMYRLWKLAETAEKIIAHMAAEQSQSEFRPVAFEFGIGINDGIDALQIALDDGGTVKITGSIDRVDAYEKDGVLYVRIIDYKTGIKTFRLSQILYGINVQMLVYLMALSRNGGEKFPGFVPAGVLYQPSSYDVSEALDRGAEGREKAVGGKFKMNGLVLDDDDVICAMECDVAGKFIPVTAKKGGGYKYASIASAEGFKNIELHLEKLIRNMGHELHSGSIAAVPVHDGYVPCKYCDYRAVCLYEDGDSEVKMENPGNDAVLEMLDSESQPVVSQ